MDWRLMDFKLHSLGLSQKISLKFLKKPNCGSVPRMIWWRRWWVLRVVSADPLQPHSNHEEERPAGCLSEETEVLC